MESESCMSVAPRGEFAFHLDTVIRECNIKKIIETGTYLGRGSTSILYWSSCANSDSKIITIEVNPEHHAKAVEYFRAERMNSIQALCGLSISRKSIPTPDKIHSRFVAHEVPGIYYDHSPEERVEKYFTETDFPKADDMLLLRAIQEFNYRPDLVFLDSAGHLGWEEFLMFSSNCQSECILALDDICHCKHITSMGEILRDPRFSILKIGTEKFGYGIFKFQPHS